MREGRKGQVERGVAEGVRAVFVVEYCGDELCGVSQGEEGVSENVSGS